MEDIIKKNIISTTYYNKKLRDINIFMSMTYLKSPHLILYCFLVKNKNINKSNNVTARGKHSSYHLFLCDTLLFIKQTKLRVDDSVKLPPTFIYANLLTAHKSQEDHLFRPLVI